MEIYEAKTIQTQIDEAINSIKQLNEEALSFSSAKASLTEAFSHFQGMLQKMTVLIDETARLHQEVNRLSVDQTLLEFSKRTNEIKSIMTKYEQDQSNTFSLYEKQAQEIITKTKESIQNAFRTFLDRAEVLTKSISDFEEKQSKVVLEIKNSSMDVVTKTQAMLQQTQRKLMRFVSVISIGTVIVSIIIALLVK